MRLEIQSEMTKRIGNGAGRSLLVWSGYAHELGDNGQIADAKVTLLIGPAVESTDQYLWIETNGDPLMIGWLNDQGGIDYNDAEIVGSGGRIVDLDEEDMRWVSDAIANAGL